jgi:ketosteroid isomerase-like protein
VTQWAAAFHRHDVAAAAALYHGDAMNIQVPCGEPVLGRQAMLDAFTAILGASPDGHSQIEHLLEDGEWVIIFCVVTGTEPRGLGSLGYQSN